MKGRKLIDLKRTDPDYRSREETARTEHAKRTLMSGALVLGTLAVLGSLATRTLSLLTGRRMV